MFCNTSQYSTEYFFHHTCYCIGYNTHYIFCNACAFSTMCNAFPATHSTFGIVWINFATMQILFCKKIDDLYIIYNAYLLLHFTMRIIYNTGYIFYHRSVVNN